MSTENAQTSAPLEPLSERALQWVEDAMKLPLADIAIEPDDECCFNCHFWEHQDNPMAGVDGSGVCRRHAPVTIYGLIRWDRGPKTDDDGLDAAPVWPETKSDDWCGDFVGGNDGTQYLRELRTNSQLRREALERTARWFFAAH